MFFLSCLNFPWWKYQLYLNNFWCFYGFKPFYFKTQMSIKKKNLNLRPRLGKCWREVNNKILNKVMRETTFIINLYIFVLNFFRTTKLLDEIKLKIILSRDVFLRKEKLAKSIWWFNLNSATKSIKSVFC